MKIITIDIHKCVGCGNCEMACAFEKTGRTCRREESNIRVNHYIEEHLIVPMTCLHCEDAWCLRACPTGALYRGQDTHAVLVDQERCAGCRMCVMACPFGNMYFNDATRTSRKCDLCNGKPRCVEHCIAGALNYEEVEEFAFRRRHKIDRLLAQAERAEDKLQSLDAHDGVKE